MITKKENLKRLNQRIANLKLKGKIILAFDFDELIVPIHMTRKICGAISKPIDKKKLEELNPCSFKGILYLTNLMKGVNFKKYEEVKNKINKKTPWSKGFKKLLLRLDKKYSIIIISSGLKDIVYSKLKEINLSKQNILGGELLILNNKIVSPSLIISNKDKGEIIKKLKRNGFYLISIGHGLGDKEMIERSNFGILFNKKINSFGDYKTENVKDIEKKIDEISNNI